MSEREQTPFVSAGELVGDELLEGLLPGGLRVNETTLADMTEVLNYLNGVESSILTGWICCAYRPEVIWIDESSEKQVQDLRWLEYSELYLKDDRSLHLRHSGGSWIVQEIAPDPDPDSGARVCEVRIRHGSAHPLEYEVGLQLTADPSDADQKVWMPVAWRFTGEEHRDRTGEPT